MLVYHQEVEEKRARLSICYVRCLRPRLLTGFQHVPSEALFDLGKDIWKVPEEHWWRCPLVDIEPHGGLEVVCCTDQGAG